MPSKSEKQRRFMEIAAHNPEFAEKAGIDSDVAKHWHEEDKKVEKKDSTDKDGKSND